MIEIERNKKPVKEVSVVPLINVIFLLLIFFLVAGTLKALEIIQIEEPVAETHSTVAEGRIVVMLGRYDEILVNDELLESHDQLSVKLADLLKESGTAIITIRADARLPAGRLVDVMNTIEATGGKNIALSVQTL